MCGFATRCTSCWLCTGSVRLHPLRGRVPCAEDAIPDPVRASASDYNSAGSPASALGGPSAGRGQLGGAHLQLAPAARPPLPDRADVPVEGPKTKPAAPSRRPTSAVGWEWGIARSRWTAGAGWWATTGARSTPALDLAARADRRGRLGRAAIGQVSMGSTSPWVANGAVVEGERHALGGLGRSRRCARSPGVRFHSAGRGLLVSGDVPRRSRHASAGSTPTPPAASTTRSTARSPPCSAGRAEGAARRGRSRSAAAPPTSWACARTTTA